METGGGIDMVQQIRDISHSRPYAQGSPIGLYQPVSGPTRLPLLNSGHWYQEV